MSDTLQEGEDQMTNQTTNYDCCKGGDHHMPWCFEAVKVPEAVISSVKPQPATRGGSDKWHVGSLAIHGYRIYTASGREVVSDIYCREDADQIVTEHNQHQALVAERERLIIAARAVVERLADLPRYLEKNGTDTLATMTAECLADLAVAIPAEQRSTSE